jgi:hypothetical protein
MEDEYNIVNDVKTITNRKKKPDGIIRKIFLTSKG